MKKPYFSIIIPALNEENHLPLLLRDLSLQEFRLFEVIVIDGNSQDKTREKAALYRKKLPELKIITSPKCNLSHQRNLGAKHAAAELLLFLDADVRINDVFLQSLNSVYQKSQPDVFTTFQVPVEKNPFNLFTSKLVNLCLAFASFLNQPAGPACIGSTRTAFYKIKGFRNLVFEDRYFFQQAVRQGFKYQLFPNPKFGSSFRRFHRKNYLKAVGEYLAVNLQLLYIKIFNKNLYYRARIQYPTGGHIHKR